MSTSEETIREAADVFEAYLDKAAYEGVDIHNLNLASNLAEYAAERGLLRQETKEERSFGTINGQGPIRRYVTEWEEVPDGE